MLSRTSPEGDGGQRGEFCGGVLSRTLAPERCCLVYVLLLTFQGASPTSGGCFWGVHRNVLHPCEGNGPPAESYHNRPQWVQSIPRPGSHLLQGGARGPYVHGRRVTTRPPLGRLGVLSRTAPPLWGQVYNNRLDRQLQALFACSMFCTTKLKSCGKKCTK